MEFSKKTGFGNIINMYPVISCDERESQKLEKYENSQKTNDSINANVPVYIESSTFSQNAGKLTTMQIGFIIAVTVTAFVFYWCNKLEADNRSMGDMDIAESEVNGSGNDSV